MVSRAAQNRQLEALNDSVNAAQLQIAREDQPLLSEARALPDAELINKLTACGITIDAARLNKLARNFPSAESLAHWLIKEDRANCAAFAHAEDWIWMSLVCLRERWCPQHPSFEQFEDLIDRGYALCAASQPESACAEWGRAWQCLQKLLRSFRFDSMDDFDTCLDGDYRVTDWCLDFTATLGDLAANSLTWAATRLVVCQQTLQLLETTPSALASLPAIQLALAESHFRVGDGRTADRYFAECLEETPTLSVAWASWSEHYLSPGVLQQPGRAEVIAKRGLKHADRETQKRLWGIIATVCAGAERPAEANAAREAQCALMNVEREVLPISKAA